MVQGSGQMGELLGRCRRRRRRRRHLEIGVWNSFSFWPESVSDERSRRENRTILREISARVIFDKITKYREKKTYFQYFQDMGKLEKSNFQYFQD